ncbi:MAG: methyltransferase domain-containing protein [Acidobacteriota bacterium]|nr:methyltransferase domain-containing protein [Acidobacteriota bacterium]
MATDDATELLAAWETSSQYWNKYRTLIEKMFAPLTGALIEHAHIGPGQSVLDVGGGNGEPSLTIAPIVGSSGRVTYTDPAAGMVKAAQNEAQERRLTNIQFHQCAAQDLPFSNNSFDVAVSRLPAMFFTDVPASLSEILRVVKPGNYVSFVVWAAEGVNPFFSVITEILKRFLPAEPPDEDLPTAFRFARPGKLVKVLQEAGATSVTERTLAFKIEAPMTVARFWELRTEMSDTFRNKLKKLAPEQVAAVREAVEKAAGEYFLNGQMNFPARGLIVTGKKLNSSIVNEPRL